MYSDGFGNTVLYVCGGATIAAEAFCGGATIAAEACCSRPPSILPGCSASADQFALSSIHFRSMLSLSYYVLTGAWRASSRFRNSRVGFAETWEFEAGCQVADSAIDGSDGLFREFEGRGSEKAGKQGVEPVGAAEPAAPSAPPASDDVDLEAPLLQRNGTDHSDPHHDIVPEQMQVPPVLLQAPPPDNDPLLYVCRVLSAVTAVGALLCLVVNAISLLRSFDYRGFDYRVSVFVSILRSYTIAIAGLVILAETEWELLYRLWGVLEFWVGRGLFQILVASLTRVLRRASGETPAESLLHEIASWWLFACGILYSVAGLLCLGRIKRSHLNRQTRYLQAKRDLEELHRRRADLEGQIARHRD